MAQVRTNTPFIAHGQFPEVAYRAFTEKQHMDAFLRGTIRLGSLSVYRALEDDARRDNLEGISHLSHNGLDHHGAMPGTAAYVLCCSTSVEALRRTSLGQWIVRIRNPRALAERMTDALVSRPELFYEGVEGVVVRYSKGHVRALMPNPMELIRLSYAQKPERFAADEEFRFVAIRKTIGALANQDYLTLELPPVVELLEPIASVGVVQDTYCQVAYEPR
jgi:hypothetical protein